MCKILKNITGFLLGIPFVWIGYDHFLRPEIFDPLVPSYLGFPRFWTLFSGVLEIILGIGVMIPFSRRLAARLLIIFLVCVYLANLNMWLNDVPFNGTLLSSNGHLIRLLIQIVLILINLWLAELFIWQSRKDPEEKVN